MLEQAQLPHLPLTRLLLLVAAEEFAYEDNLCVGRGMHGAMGGS